MTSSSKLSKDIMMELMAYADGELEAPERARVEKLIAANEDARRVVEAIGVLGDFVEQSHDDSHGVANESLVDDIMARVEKEGAPRKSSIRPPRVIDLRDARENRVKVAAAVVAAIALAAGIVLTTRKANESTPFQATRPPIAHTSSPDPGPAPPSPVPDPASQVAAAGGVDVDQVDTNHDVEVFYLPSSVGANASSVVVWIDDKGASK